jgi:hypothetical protein
VACDAAHDFLNVGIHTLLVFLGEMQAETERTSFSSTSSGLSAWGGRRGYCSTMAVEVLRSRAAGPSTCGPAPARQMSRASPQYAAGSHHKVGRPAGYPAKSARRESLWAVPRRQTLRYTCRCAIRLRPTWPLLEQVVEQSRRGVSTEPRRETDLAAAQLHLTLPVVGVHHA